ncbi:hypothetical protein [Acidocella sp.]|jgi:hypothetical protein|uniref:hypothetical protein n=1 Tax=Acidocella sp. TaxID=50710 RepID=UPI00262CC7D3|nr:hypothetical protein [Acidocella sp.]
MTSATEKKRSKGQTAYEQERARKAGMSLEEWLKRKAKQAEDEAQKAKPKPEKKKGLISRLLDKAHKPL